MLRGGAKVNDIKRWLEDLDLGRYVEAFLFTGNFDARLIFVQHPSDTRNIHHACAFDSIVARGRLLSEF